MAANTRKTSPTQASKTGAKSASGRSRAGSGAKGPASQKAAKERARRQLWAILVFALAVLFASITLIEGQNVWLAIHNLVLGLFGWSAYLIAPLLFYIAIMATLDKPLGPVGHKVWQAFVLIGLISGAIQIFGPGIPDASGLINRGRALFEAGKALEGGGLVSAFFGLPFLHWFGDTGARITICLLIFVFVMILTGGTLIGLCRSASRPVKKIEEAYTERAVQRAAEPERHPFNIDIPLDDEMPPHPVSSPKGSIQERKRHAKDVLLGREEPPAPEPAPEEPSPEPASNPVPEPEAIPIPLTEEEPESPEGTLPGGLPREQEAQADMKTAPPAPERQLRKESPRQDEEPFDRLAQGMEQLTLEEEEGEAYRFPPLSLLAEPVPQDSSSLQEEERANARKLVETLQSFSVKVQVLGVSRGPAVTRYELQPAAGVKVSRITGLADDIALSLAASGVRIEAPIPNKSAVGIEVPNRTVSAVPIREILESDAFQSASSRLTVALGKDIGGAASVADLAKMPHTLIAGATGSGKSVCINSLIVSILYKATPDEVRLLLVDPKMVELGVYNGIPHLLVPVVTDPKKAAGALAWAVGEMLDRYQKFQESGVRDLKGYNRLAAAREDLAPMPQIVIIIDELADLMMAAPNEVEDSICRLAQMARAAGMHLVIATQRPSVDVITGVIKANIPSRIAFAVSSQVDSRTILDSSGAEKLLGRGDMLYSPVGSSKPTRIQGCLVQDEEVERIVEFIKSSQLPQEYDQSIIDEIERQAVSEKKKSSGSGGGFDDEDEMLPSAIEIAVEAGQISTSLLQRRLKLGYARAARIIDAMEQRGIVGPSEGSKPRQVLISRERWIEMKLGASQRAKEEWGD